MDQSTQTPTNTLKIWVFWIPAVQVHTASEKEKEKKNCLQNKLSGCSGQLPGVNKLSCVKTQQSFAEKLRARSKRRRHINQDKREEKNTTQNINKRSVCLLDERLAAEHQGVVERAHAEDGDARLLHKHGARAQQQADKQRPRRDSGGQRDLGDAHTHTPGRQIGGRTKSH